MSRTRPVSRTSRTERDLAEALEMLGRPDGDPARRREAQRQLLGRGKRALPVPRRDGGDRAGAVRARSPRRRVSRSPRETSDRLLREVSPDGRRSRRSSIEASEKDTRRASSSAGEPHGAVASRSRRTTRSSAARSARFISAARFPARDDVPACRYSDGGPADRRHVLAAQGRRRAASAIDFLV